MSKLRATELNKENTWGLSEKHSGSKNILKLFNSYSYYTYICL